MANYKLLTKPSAGKELEVLPMKDRKRVVAKIQRLAIEPRPPGCEKLSGDDKLRIRQGNYRILYTVNDANQQIIIVKIRHRREVYR